MCTSAPAQQRSEEICSIVRTLTELPPNTDADDLDPAGLSSSLQSVDIDFGIVDSLTLASKNLHKISLHVQDTSVRGDDDDDIESVWKEFEASWSSGIAMAKKTDIAPRRTGVRRGHHASNKIIKVSTKTYDGPKWSPARAA